MANNEIELEVIDEDECVPICDQQQAQPNQAMIAAYRQTQKQYAEWNSPTTSTVKKV